MLGLTRFNVTPFFYPFGNTPAINLLQSRRPACENDDAVRVLLLGCGDPRNLLFTLWCNKGKASYHLRIYFRTDADTNALFCR
ncbi:hypothetical protein BCIN_15g05040 [Botrytis cinerea B05.10]|uniref:DUF4470 domain-containing protein n=1 Tax=Botryotinia fuckeliana (strain B05.10) TaxID=332648 RepID=A0A384K5B4_BOTFB|nr:hypothetical protein BCIN_15g05040 [Botrytis cinerea B05.10]XP_024553499.1 hypothetical protein BCIN_15g05040 [Botrytis cinerea B05.10]ATZ58019.1 hypothetical protein BCIN_15g05040 [Botrytis cinerea B05.10]ATZ58020.1 hypothetical protein BCIN_15g05040 [Botrytis cinerea B05.10]